MGSDTASNHNRTIATKGTEHVARTPGAIDVCQGPDKPAPFPNEIPTTKLAPNNTQKTKIGGKEIWIEKGDIGVPGQSDAMHPSHSVGIASGKPHRGEAHPVTVSTDVVAEGDGVVRTDDTTTQNSANTSGFVDGSALGEGKDGVEENLDLKCAIIKLTGKNTPAGMDKTSGNVTTGGSKGAARELGWPGKKSKVDAFYLEILAGGTLEFESTREDQTKDPCVKDPDCPRPDKSTGKNHTSWTYSHQDPWQDKTEDATGKTLTLSGDWTNYGPQGVKKAAKEVGTSAVDRVVGSALKTHGGHTGGASLDTFLKLWRARKNPGVLNVSASGCSGTKLANIKILPAEVFSLKYSVDFAKTNKAPSAGASVDKLKTLFDKLKRVKQLIDTVQSFGGGGTSAHVARDEASRRGGKKQTKKTAGVELGFQYVELTEEKKGAFGDLYTPALVNRKWSLKIFLTVFDVTLRFTIPLAQFLTALGPVVAGTVRLLRIRADLVLTLNVSLTFDLAVGRDEYDFPTKHGGSATLKVTFTAALKLSVANVNIMTLSAAAPASVTGQIRLGDKPEVLMTAQITGKVQINLTCTFFESSRWFEKKCKPYTPEWSKASYDGTKFPLFSAK